MSYGRGSRGAAILKALENQARKPGQDAALQHQYGGAGDAPLPAPMGRGALMALLMKQREAEAVAAAARVSPLASQPPPNAAMPMGRGRGLLAMTARTPPQPSHSPVPVTAAACARAPPAAPLVRPVGRGMGLLQSMAPANTDQPPQTTPANSGPPLNTTPASTGERQQPSQPAPESSTDASSETGLPSMLGKVSLQTQYERGALGKKIPIMANYLKIQMEHEVVVHQYQVTIEPILDNHNVRRRLVRELPNLPRPFEFDGGSMMVMPVKIPGYAGTATSREGQEYHIALKHVGAVEFASMTQFFNILFNRIMYELKLCPVGRMFYDPSKPISIHQYKMEVWPGYVTSVRQYDGGLMCLVDTTHKVLRTETVLDVMTDSIVRNPQDYRDQITKDVVGMVVLTRYNNKTYRIDDIDWEQNPKSMFETRRDGRINYIDYYKSHWGKEITDFDQPLLVHKPTKRGMEGSVEMVIYLVPELSFITGLTQKARTDFRLMKDLATHTRITPSQRQQRLQQFTENVNSHPVARQILSSWGLRLANQACHIEGRLFEPETIYLGNNRTVSAGEKAEWSSAFNRNTIREPVDLKVWLLVCTQRNQHDVRYFLSQLENCYKSLGVQIYPPSFKCIPNDRTETYLAEIRRNLSPEVQLVMTVFPTSRDDRYAAIKKLCYCETPVASQVINLRTISRKDKVRSVAQKVALQMNCKLGGGLWSVKIPRSDIMIVGIDTYHDTQRGKNSWGGFVASLNRDCTQWYSKVYRQMPGQELCNGLQICMHGALRQYSMLNGVPPERIIIFRDGVSDGDLANVRELEVSQFANTFPKFGENYQPKLSCIVVQKRVNTKLYLRQGVDRVDNPPPGTVVDHTVTRRNLVDFYVVSQFVRQGTVTPTHYVVVHDESGWKIDILQKLAYKMTHMYYNWCGTIRSPAPCQYAHKLAYMVGESLHKDPDDRLCTRLFFL